MGVPSEKGEGGFNKYLGIPVRVTSLIRDRLNNERTIMEKTQKPSPKMLLFCSQFVCFSLFANCFLFQTLWLNSSSWSYGVHLASTKLKSSETDGLHRRLALFDYYYIVTVILCYYDMLIYMCYCIFYTLIMLKLHCKCFSQSSMYRNFINYVYLKKKKEWNKTIVQVSNIFIIYFLIYMDVSTNT